MGIVRPTIRVSYILIVLLLFFFGINIPQLSQLTVYVFIFMLFVQWRGSIKTHFIVPFVLLGTFCALYYLIIYSHGFIEWPQAIHRPILFLGFYALGYSLTRKKTPYWPYGLIWLLIIMISGFVVFTYLSAFLNPRQTVDMLLRLPAIENIWRSGELVLVTGFGLFASLGLCLLPVVLFGKDSATRGYQYLLLAFAIGVIFMGSLYASILFQNRSPLAALAISFVASMIIFSAKKNVGRMTKIFVSLVLISLIVIVIRNPTTITEAHIFGRFTERGLSTPRFYAWKDLVVGLPSHLLGGRDFDLGGLDYVHNLWLDLAFDAGILPVLCLIGFQAVHVRDFIRIIASGVPLLVTLGFVCTTISFLVGFMFEPALQCSAPYFASSCFLLGMARSLSLDIGKLSRKVVLRGKNE